MKQALKVFIIVISILVYQGCKTNTDQSAKEQSSTDKSGNNSQEIKDQTTTGYVSGVVEEIQQGKDGYTAKIKADNDSTYFATISIANLKDNSAQYRAVKVGESISIKGDTWKMGEENHITVRELK